MGGYDVVVLDRDLPRLHGDQLCRRLVESGSPAKILMLTASNTLTDRVVGLNLGADDYLGKPVRLIELLARLRALTRRRGEAAPDVVEFADLRLDRQSGRVWRGATELELTPREFMLLEELMQAGGGWLSVHQLLHRVFDGASDRPTAAAVRLAVMRLRRKLGAPAAIASARGRGYRLS
jgi:DNA-binding response OmpR family regulator